MFCGLLYIVSDICNNTPVKFVTGLAVLYYTSIKNVVYAFLPSFSSFVTVVCGIKRCGRIPSLCLCRFLCYHWSCSQVASFSLVVCCKSIVWCKIFFTTFIKFFAIFRVLCRVSGRVLGVVGHFGRFIGWFVYSLITCRLTLITKWHCLFSTQKFGDVFLFVASLGIFVKYFF